VWCCAFFAFAFFFFFCLAFGFFFFVGGGGEWGSFFGQIFFIANFLDYHVALIFCDFCGFFTIRKKSSHENKFSAKLFSAKSYSTVEF